MDDINRPLPPQQKPETEIDQPVTTPEVHQPVVGHVHHGSKKKAVVRIVLTLLLAALAAAGVYLWQHGKTTDLQSQLNAKDSELRDAVAASAISGQAKKDDAQTTTSNSAPSSTGSGLTSVVTTSNLSEDLIPGDVDTGRGDGSTSITGIFKFSLAPTAVWVEFGTTPTKLDKATVKNTKGLGEGDPDAVYATGETFSISNSQLTAGTTYYYRTAATVKGKTLYSGVASFVAKK